MFSKKLLSSVNVKYINGRQVNKLDLKLVKSD